MKKDKFTLACNTDHCANNATVCTIAGEWLCAKCHQAKRDAIEAIGNSFYSINK